MAWPSKRGWANFFNVFKISAIRFCQIGLQTYENSPQWLFFLEKLSPFVNDWDVSVCLIRRRCKHFFNSFCLSPLPSNPGCVFVNTSPGPILESKNLSLLGSVIIIAAIAYIGLALTSFFSLNLAALNFNRNFYVGFCYIFAWISGILFIIGGALQIASAEPERVIKTQHTF